MEKQRKEIKKTTFLLTRIHKFSVKELLTSINIFSKSDTLQQNERMKHKQFTLFFDLQACPRVENKYSLNQTVQ